MTEETYSGAPRSKIPWYPTINLGKCNQCEGGPQCLRFCPHDVFEYDREGKCLKVKNPYNCVVFCRACSKVCAADALGFPDKKEILKVIKNAREGKA